MKKVFTIIAAITLSFGSFAQQIPNGGFETWTDTLHPDYWSTIADVYGPQFSSFARKDTTAGNHVQGSASLRLFSDSVPGQGTIVSLVGLGRDTFSAFGIDFYNYPYTKRPDSLFFSVKYTPGPGAVADTAYVQFNLTQAGTSLFGGVGYVPVPSTNSLWLNYVVPIASYYSGAVTGAPDSLMLIFASGNLLTIPNSVYGSTLWVDSVHFDASINVGIEPIGEVKGVNAYPSPATNQINISVQADEVGSRIQLFDMEGRVVYEGIINSTISVIDTRSLQSGVYSIRVNSIDHLTTYNGKISIAK
jgi:hypothetical protein